MLKCPAVLSRCLLYWHVFAFAIKSGVSQHFSWAGPPENQKAGDSKPTLTIQPTFLLYFSQPFLVWVSEGQVCWIPGSATPCNLAVYSAARFVLHFAWNRNVSLLCFVFSTRGGTQGPAPARWLLYYRAVSLALGCCFCLWDKLSQFSTY